MLENIPNEKAMTVLIGSPLYAVWTMLCDLIEAN